MLAGALGLGGRRPALGFVHQDCYTSGDIRFVKSITGNLTTERPMDISEKIPRGDSAEDYTRAMAGDWVSSHGKYGRNRP